YFPFPESDTYWQYTYVDLPWYCPCFGYCYKSQYEISGDTIITNKTYHKLVLSRIYFDENCNETYSYLGYQVAFRNQAEEKKVWFVPSGEEDEVLLYDFNLQLGDTLPESYLIPGGLNYYVVGIDTVEVGNTFRKKYLIVNENYPFNWPYEIIEGIGGQNLIKPIEEWFNFEAGYTFGCMNNADSLIYPNGASCELITSERETFELSNVSIFPNPTSGKFWIRNNNPGIGILLIEIYSRIGEIITQLESSEPQIEIDLTGYPKGMYLVRIKNGSENIFNKIILK
ncbi:MAG: T9SS type A sorting domain-containing protein, partial [Bacteroidales bacterium]|nr:T9SS type A sorting domain-containing protein [Bacteroidales bacterium]